MIISVHMPKVAGTSFAASLKSNFGTKLLRDYDDFPINTPVLERNKFALKESLTNFEKNFDEIDCIHGHFLPVKYLLLSEVKDLTFVTWLRNPVDRVLSHYYYWKRSFDPKTSQKLHKKVVEENWSLERFCLGSELQNLYFQFLYAFPLENFSFIGISEYYNEDFNYFTNNFISSDLKPEKLNVGNHLTKGYEISQSLRNEIEDCHSIDIDLYKRALKLRQLRQVSG